MQCAYPLRSLARKSLWAYPCGIAGIKLIANYKTPVGKPISKETDILSNLNDWLDANLNAMSFKCKLANLKKI
jgi:hypothetical protein